MNLELIAGFFGVLAIAMAIAWCLRELELRNHERGRKK